MKTSRIFVITHAAALAGRRVRLTVLASSTEAAPGTPPAQARDADRVARVKSIRGKFARQRTMRASELLHEERQNDKAREERIIGED